MATLKLEHHDQEVITVVSDVVPPRGAKIELDDNRYEVQDISYRLSSRTKKLEVILHVIES